VRGACARGAGTQAGFWHWAIKTNAAILSKLLPIRRPPDRREQRDDRQRERELMDAVNSRRIGFRVAQAGPWKTNRKAPAAGPTVYHAPRWPTETLAPDLDRLMRRPGNSARRWW
jgi:hypothetical protein